MQRRFFRGIKSRIGGFPVSGVYRLSTVCGLFELYVADDRLAALTIRQKITAEDYSYAVAA